MINSILGMSVVVYMPYVYVLSLCLVVFLFKWLANAYLLFQLLHVSFIPYIIQLITSFSL